MINTKEFNISRRNLCLTCFHRSALRDSWKWNLVNKFPLALLEKTFANLPDLLYQIPVNYCWITRFFNDFASTRKWLSNWRLIQFGKSWETLFIIQVTVYFHQFSPYSIPTHLPVAASTQWMFHQNFRSLNLCVAHKSTHRLSLLCEQF